MIVPDDERAESVVLLAGPDSRGAEHGRQAGPPGGPVELTRFPTAVMGTADGTIVGTTKVVDHGPNGDKWNLVVLGDGFRAADQADYTAAVTALVNTLKATAPFDGVWDRINVHRVDVHSTDAGADDPAACADGSSPAGGTAVTAKTYFDSSFCNWASGASSSPIRRSASRPPTLRCPAGTRSS